MRPALALSFALVATGCAGAPGSGVDAARRPNVVLIMADDVGYEAFGCYGGTSYATPHVDALAASGMRFEHAYSQPLCTPSRVKIMTGRSNVRNYRAFSILDRDEITIGHVMSEAGYATAVAGKWQLYGASHYGDEAGTGTHPREAGFDTYCLWQIDELGGRYRGPRLDRDGEVLEGLEESYGPDVVCDYVLEFMEAHRDEPFFVYYPMILPHSPFVPTPASASRDEEDKQKNFADMVEYVDSIVGRIVAGLEELGLSEDTLVVFTSDNGTGRGLSSRLGGCVIEGGKSLPTDAGTRVPFVASWRGTVREGATCSDLVDFSDVLPTLAHATGAILPSDRVIDGRSFLPQLRGEPGDPRDWIYCYYNPRPGNERFPERRFARDQRYKLYGDGRLFDVTTDVLEQNPLDAGALSVEAATARAKLARAIASMPAEPEKIGE